MMPVERKLFMSYYEEELKSMKDKNENPGGPALGSAMDPLMNRGIA